MWNVIPGLSRFVGRGWGGQGAAGQDDRVPRSEPPVPRTPTPDEIPPLPSVAGRRKPRGKIAESAPPAPAPVLEALDIYTEHFGLTAQPFSRSNRKGVFS